MENRKRNIILSRLINDLYNQNYVLKQRNGKIYKYKYNGINIDSERVSINDFEKCKEELVFLKEKAKQYVKNVKNVDVFLMSEHIGVAPYVCRDLINNL